MGLATSLNATAGKLIEQYGNTVTLTSDISSGGYNPQTGEFEINTSTDYVTKSVSVSATVEAMQVAGINESSFGLVKRVYTIPYKDEYSNINSEWSINGMTIHKVVTMEAQDAKITMQLFVG